MARADSKSKLEALRKKQLAIVQKIKDAEAKEKTKQRQNDDRRNFLAGALALKEFEANPQSDFATALLALLNHGITKNSDRALFNLAPLPKQPKDGVVFIPREAEI